MPDCSSAPARDENGFLQDPASWSIEVARLLAAEESIVLGEEHLEVLRVLRDYHARHAHVPAMRALVNIVRRELGAEKGRSVYLLRLFPGSPARVAAKLAGLPKPEHCL
jgi:tRNA 2-thiouridine synthesizing protein E